MGRIQGPSPGSTGGLSYSGGVTGSVPQQLSSGAFYPSFIGYGINDANHLVGRYQTPMGPSSGWFFDGTTQVQISFPGSSGTQAFGLNDADAVVGHYDDDGVSHGFLYQGGSYETIDVPGATSTIAWDINNRGEIVGQYTDAAGQTHGYIATPVEVPEPESFVLVGVGIAVLGMSCRSAWKIDPLRG